jgi:hypothetical protein
MFRHCPSKVFPPAVIASAPPPVSSFAPAPRRRRSSSSRRAASAAMFTVGTGSGEIEAGALPPFFLSVSPPKPRRAARQPP